MIVEGLVQKIIQENKKFLDRVMDEEFEPEDDDDCETEITEEL